MSPAEWVAVLDVVGDLWPSTRWPKSAADRAYWQLRKQPASLVESAVLSLVGDRPASPAALLARVSELATGEARYPTETPALPEGYNRRQAQERALAIRGGASWGEWLAGRYEKECGDTEPTT